MSTTNQISRCPLFAALLVLAPCVGAAQTGGAAVTDPAAAVPAPAYHSALQDYQPAPARVAPDQHWLAANRAVQSSGMVMAHMAMPHMTMPQAMAPRSGTPTPPAMAPMDGMAPMPAMKDGPADRPAGQMPPHQHQLQHHHDKD